MEKKIRRGVFETNSSSMHSITIADSGELMDTLPVDADGSVVLCPGDFGWGEYTFSDAKTKASYCWQQAIGNDEAVEMLTEVICEQTGAKTVYMEESGDPYHPYGYIDHQSLGTFTEAFEDKEALRQFIFNPNSELIIDHDNH